MTIEITILPNKNLKISASPADIEDACSTRDPDALTDLDILSCLLEPCWTNGQYYVFDGDQLGHMTQAPMIADSADCDDDGKWTIQGPVWWFPEYETENCMDTLRDCGEVVFTFGYDSEESAGT